MAKLSIKNAQGNASELEFDRNGNANWLLTSDKGYLRFQSDWNGTKGSYEDVLVLSEATSGDATFKGSINASKNIFASYPTNGEADVGVRYNGGALYFWGNSGGARGIWDDNLGAVMYVSNTSAAFKGSATSLVYGDTLKTNDEINNGIIANTFSVNLWNDNSSPGAANGILLNMGYTTTTYGAQIAIDDDPTYKISLRQKNGDGWSSWKQIPMGDGTGASGTWGISVSGGAQYIPYDSNKYCDTVEKLDAMIDSKLQYTAISAGAIPSINNDGLVISVGSSTDWGAQIWVDDGASGVGMAIRSRKYGGWNNWYNVLTEANYVSYCSSKFVPLTGGTMTGKLTVQSPIVGYNYVNNNNEPAFIWDKPGSHWTGMGPNGSADTIHFGPCTADSTTDRYTWVSDYNQYWHFQGNIEATSSIYSRYVWAKKSNGEADIGVGYADGKYLYLWGDTTTGNRGIWDANKGNIISVSESGGASFHGTAASANALTTSAGSSNRPVYFSGGKPYACSGETVFAYGNDGWNCNTIYNASLYCIGGGSNCPSGSQYGALFTMPYRQPSGNIEPGYAGQIFLPNGDDGATPDGLYYRTSMSSSYRNWKSVIHSNSKKYYGSQTDMTNSTGANEGDVFFVIG